MSIIDELLVFLDDQKELSLDEIMMSLPNRSKQNISSALGRLSSKEWVKSRKLSTGKLFKISASGRQEITKNLSKIREMENHKWDGSLLLVVFSIPEKMRKSRDIFRKHIVELGFSRLMNDLWVSFWDKRKNVEQMINSLNINKFCTVFKVEKLTPSDEKNIIENITWNKNEINLLYKRFISDAKKYLLTKKNSFGARLLVYNYTKALSRDPQLPEKIRPKDYPGIEAYNFYLKIRPYCYK